ncbi:LuxR C-terminal-related transcriptional regulator [Actinoplanes sp. NPDC051411]|uniref:helix-turn-helix transcriptional regulator n=1 Tax=Actinoplanes sp. NPDC051411 TaxID=3155522 RepID=UPI00342A5AC0
MDTTLSTFDSARELYRFAADHPDWSEASAARHIPMPLSEVRAAADLLLRAGLLRAAGDRPSGTSTVGAGAAMSRLIDQGQAALDDCRRGLEFLGAAMPFMAQTAIDAAHANRTAVETERVIGAAAVDAALDHWAATATGELLSLHPQRLPTAVGWNTVHHRLLTTVRRGVATRYVHRVADNTQGNRRLADLSTGGVDVRSLPVIPFPLMVVDAELAVVIDAEPDGEPSALVIHCPAVAGVLRQVFEHYWQSATAPEAPAGLSPVSAHRRAVLGMMAAGLKDESIARELGVSVRTLRRQVAELMDELGLRTRFQLGAHSREIAWIARAGETTHVA